MFKCECGREFNTQNGLNSHKGKCKIINPNYIHPTVNKMRKDHNCGWSKGLNKYNDERIKKQGESLSRNISLGLVTPSFKGKQHTEETKEKIRKARFKYLQEKHGDTAWEKVQQGEMTYLENKFYEEVNKHKLYEKFDIVFQYSLYPYFLDFAFTNIKLDVEIDGKCHFRFNDRIYHDIKRDNILIKKYNWTVFRIAYNDNWNDKIQELLKLLTNIENYNNKSLENRLYYNRCNEQDKECIKNIRNQELDKLVKQEIKTSKQLKYLEQKEKQIEEIRQKLLNSNIDFSKFGWVGNASKIIGISSQKVNQWMKRNMLEFYNEKCFKRKSKV